jgi:hypothetical protein
MPMHKEQAPNNQPQRVKVIVEEYERGWGSRVNGRLYFDTPDEADAYVQEFNLKNLQEPGQAVPDWYMIATREAY